MESLINNVDLSDMMIISLIAGYIFCILEHGLERFLDYLECKAWRINDYERIIYLLNKENSLSFTDEDFETMYEAINNYAITLEREEKRKEKREKFLNKFRKK